MAKEEFVIHPHLSPDSYAAFKDEKKAFEHIRSKDFTPDRYVDLLSGMYGHASPDLTDYSHRELLGGLKNHPHATNEELNSKIADTLLARSKHISETGKIYVMIQIKPYLLF